MSEVKVKTKSSEMFFILMSLIATGPFKIVANNTDKNYRYFDCLKKYNFGIGDLKMITVHISDVFATTTGTSLPAS